MARVPLTIDLASPTTGLAVVGGTVTVKIADTLANATLYAGRTGPAQVANPLVSDANGMASCWVDRDLYKLVYGGGVVRPDEYWGAAATADGEIDADWLGGVTGGMTYYATTAAFLAAGVPTSIRAMAYVADDWGGTVYGAKADLSGWYTIHSNNIKTATLAAATDATIAGLDGDTDGIYLCEYSGRWTTGGGGSDHLYVQPNADTTQANYTQRLGDHVYYGLSAPTAIGGTSDPPGFLLAFGVNGGATYSMMASLDIRANRATGLATGVAHWGMVYGSAAGQNATGRSTQGYAGANIASLKLRSRDGGALNGTFTVRRLVTPA